MWISNERIEGPLYRIRKSISEIWSACLKFIMKTWNRINKLKTEIKNLRSKIEQHEDTENATLTITYLQDSLVQGRAEHQVLLKNIQDLWNLQTQEGPSSSFVNVNRERSKIPISTDWYADLDKIQDDHEEKLKRILKFMPEVNKMFEKLEKDYKCKKC